MQPKDIVVIDGHSTHVIGWDGRVGGGVVADKANSNLEAPA